MLFTDVIPHDPEQCLDQLLRQLTALHDHIENQVPTRDRASATYTAYCRQWVEAKYELVWHELKVRAIDENDARLTDIWGKFEALMPLVRYKYSFEFIQTCNMTGFEAHKVSPEYYLAIAHGNAHRIKCKQHDSSWVLEGLNNVGY